MLSRSYDGCTDLWVGRDVGHGRPVPMAVRCIFEGLPGEYYAFVDTGADFSIMPLGMAEALGIPSAGNAEDTYNTRCGVLKGSHVRHQVCLQAREGESLELDAEWFVSRDWPYQAVIGWYGFLESIRFGCDPGVQPEDEPEFLYALP